MGTLEIMVSREKMSSETRQLNGLKYVKMVRLVRDPEWGELKGDFEAGEVIEVDGN